MPLLKGLFPSGTRSMVFNAGPAQFPATFHSSADMKKARPQGSTPFEVFQASAKMAFRPDGVQPSRSSIFFCSSLSSPG